MLKDKADVLLAELVRLVREARANDTEVDLDRRRSPGPVSDEEWEEFVGSLGRVSNRTYTLKDRTNRRLTMTRRGQ